MLSDKIKQTVREVPDFPKKGVNFKDITPILENPGLCLEIVDELTHRFHGTKIDAIVGIESRGFLFGMMLAQKWNIPFLTVRKQGKLPFKTISFQYELEYGTAVMEMHVNSVKPGWNVLIHDDLLATGGTAAAAAELVTMQKGNIAGFAFIIELSFLKGVDRINKYSEKIVTLLKY
mgnify:CR=1 FL=1